MASEIGRESQGGEEVKPAKPRIAGRIVLIIVLVTVAALGAWWRAVASDLSKAITLYDEGKYREAEMLLEKVIQHPMSAFRIRAEAKKALGLCKAEMASDIAFTDRTIEGYDRALRLLEEARRLAGPTAEIERRIAEYSGYRQKLLETREAVESREPSPEPPAH